MGKTWDSLLKATEEVCGWTKGHARHIYRHGGGMKKLGQ